jgi:hypothetical protein
VLQLARSQSVACLLWDRFASACPRATLGARARPQHVHDPARPEEGPTFTYKELLGIPESQMRATMIGFQAVPFPSST